MENNSKQLPVKYKTNLKSWQRTTSAGVCPTTAYSTTTLRYFLSNSAAAAAVRLGDSTTSQVVLISVCLAGHSSGPRLGHASQAVLQQQQQQPAAAAAADLLSLTARNVLSHCSTNSQLCNAACQKKKKLLPRPGGRPPRIMRVGGRGKTGACSGQPELSRRPALMSTLASQ